MTKSQLILFGSLAFIVVIAVLMILGIIPGLKKDINTTTASLIIWNYADSPTVWNQIIGVYNAANPNIKITYVQKDPARFETDLLNALASGTGPDIWSIKQSWILKHKDKVFPLPEVSLQFAKTDYQQLFADATFHFIQDSQIIGLPISLDTLALYYNKDIFNSENIPNPPQTWDDLLAITRKTTKVSLTGDIIQGGISLGSSRNVEHFVDIVSALFLQNGLAILYPAEKKSDLGTPQAANAVEFYRSFSDSLRKNFSWSDTLPNSIDAFASSKSAMMVGFSSDYDRIRAKNPRLNFDIAPLPQQKGTTVRTNYGIVSGFAVSRTSASPIEAWRFLVFATTNPEAVKFYLNASGKPPAYRQYVAADFLAPYLRVFQTQVLSAKTWLQPDEKAVSSIFDNMVQSARGNISNISSVTGSAGGRLEQLLGPK